MAVVGLALACGRTTDDSDSGSDTLDDLASTGGTGSVSGGHEGSGSASSGSVSSAGGRSAEDEGSGVGGARLSFEADPLCPFVPLGLIEVPCTQEDIIVERICGFLFLPESVRIPFDLSGVPVPSDGLRLVLLPRGGDASWGGAPAVISEFLQVAVSLKPSDAGRVRYPGPFSVEKEGALVEGIIDPWAPLTQKYLDYYALEKVTGLNGTIAVAQVGLLGEGDVLLEARRAIMTVGRVSCPDF